jgi:hypothetical protein
MQRTNDSRSHVGLREGSSEANAGKEELEQAKLMKKW